MVELTLLKSFVAFSPTLRKFSEEFPLSTNVVSTCIHGGNLYSDVKIVLSFRKTTTTTVEIIFLKLEILD